MPKLLTLKAANTLWFHSLYKMTETEKTNIILTFRKSQV